MDPSSPSSLLRTTKVLTLILPIAVLAICGWIQVRNAQNPEVTIYAWRLPSGPVFLAEDPQNADLQAFARREHLQDVVRPFKTDMEKLLALCQWASASFTNSNPFPNYPPWNASVILDWIRKGKTGGFCAQYAFVFGQACQSQGYFPRYNDVASPENKGGHFTISVYVPSLKKWVVFEPTWGHYYIDAKGTPLGMMELHEYAVGIRKGTIYEYPSHKAVPKGIVRLFYFFRYYLRNNFLTVPVFADRSNGDYGFEQYRLAWMDSFTQMPTDKIQAIPSRDVGDYIYAMDVTHPSYEIRCHDRFDFIRQIGAIPQLQLVKVHIQRSNLENLIKFNFVDNSNYHRLTGRS